MTTVNPKQSTTYALSAGASTLTLGAKTNIDVTKVGAAGVYGASDVLWSVTNLGSVAGSAAFVFEGNATLVNGATGKINNPTGKYTAVYVAGIGEVTNAGSITHSSANGGSTSAVYLLGGGKILNKASGAITGDIATIGTGTITNKGSITNSGTHFSLMSLDGGGTETNSGTLDMTGATSAHSSGMYLKNGGTATNTGKITGSTIYMSGMLSASGGTLTNSGTIKLASAQHISGIELEAGGVVDNTGKIKVTVTTAHASGIELIAGGSITNSGSVIVSSPSYGSGVTFKNGGSLDNVAGGYISAPNRAGVYAGGSTGATITNAGTITGGDSIEFDNIGTSSAAIINTLILQSGSDLIGQALGSTGAFVTNDLVFQGTGTAGNVFADFQSLTVDSGASWKISAAAGIAATTVEGTLKVTKTGSLSGTTTIEGGTAIFKSSYENGVTFAGAGELELGNAYTGVISGLGASDKIDLLDLAFKAGDKASVSGAVLTIESASSQSLATLTLDNSAYSSSNFTVGKDAAGHVLVSYA